MKISPDLAREHVKFVGKSYYRDLCLCGDLERLVGSTTLLTTYKHVLFDSNILLVETLRNDLVHPMFPLNIDMTRDQKIMCHSSFCNLDLPRLVVWHSDMFSRYSIA